MLGYIYFTLSPQQKLQGQELHILLVVTMGQLIVSQNTDMVCYCMPALYLALFIDSKSLTLTIPKGGITTHLLLMGKLSFTWQILLKTGQKGRDKAGLEVKIDSASKFMDFP